MEEKSIPDNRDRDVSVKIREHTRRNARIAAALVGVSMIDWIDQIVTAALKQVLAPREDESNE